MRKLIMWNVVTLDGYFEGEKPWDLDFHQLVWGPELQQLSNEQLKSADMLVFGHRTYQGMYEYWSKAQGETAEDGETIKYMNSLPKIVCSPTLTTADWNNTTVVHEAVAEIKKIKEEGDGIMFVFGSADLSQSLIKADLFDEYRLCIAPVILGKGGRLFKEGLPRQDQNLLESRSLQSGGVMVRYSPKSRNN